MSSVAEGLCAIAFGPGGLTQLRMFEETLYRIAHDLEREANDIQPTDYFDLFSGTGLGGFKVADVNAFHQVLQTRLFDSRGWNSKNTAACTTLLNTILDKHLDQKILDDSLDARGTPKGMVCVTDPSFPSTARFLRTYTVREGFGPRCTVHEALHATLADGVHLPSVSIEGDQAREDFVAATAAYPNPTPLLMKETSRCFSPGRFIACIVNLGAGRLSPTFPMTPSESFFNLVLAFCYALLRIISLNYLPNDTVTDDSKFKSLGYLCASVTDAISSQCHDLGSFFYPLSVVSLHNVKWGADAAGAILAATNAYLLQDEISRMCLRRCNIPFRLNPCSVSLAGLDGKSELQAKVDHISSKVDLAEIKNILRPNISIPLLGQHSSCLENTRQSISAKVLACVNNPHTPNVCVLVGHPGTGKSTLMTSIAQYLADSGTLGAQFFCRRDESAAHSVRNIWRLISLDLVQKQPEFARVLSSQFDTKVPDVDALSDDRLFEAILEQPFIMATFPRSLVVVIDAIDEFGGMDASSYDRRRELCKSLLLWKRLPSNVKLLLSTREQSDVMTALQVHSSMQFSLDIPEHAPQADIQLYFEKRLSEISLSYNTLPTPWPDPKDLNLLITRAAGLFIWAYTIVALVEQRPSVLDELMFQIRDGSLAVSGNINALYATLLTSAFPKPHSLFSAVISAIGASVIPLSQQALSEFLGAPEAHVEEVCVKLRPVLTATTTLRFHHQSFIDFVNHPDYTEDFRTSSEDQQIFMLDACFGIINSPQLYFNMASMESSYLLHQDIPGLRERIPEHVRYACRALTAHWSHRMLILTEEMLTNVVEKVKDFMEHKLLFWLEVVCIESVLLDVAQDIRYLASTYVSPMGHITYFSINLQYEVIDLAQWFSDILSFINILGGPIRHSYPHIYLSALPFAPSDSLIFQNYSHFREQSLAIAGLPAYWPPAQPIFVGSSVSDIAFSPDGRQIVSGSEDKVLRIWDAQSGQAVRELQGHERRVTCVAFSSDGRHIVSGSEDKTLRIWDAESGEALGVLQRGHEDYVDYFIYVAFSPDGRHIISCSWDMQIWDVESRAPLGDPIPGIHRAAFSSDGRRIVSTFSNNTVQIWDVESGRAIGDPLRGHESYITCVAFSPDGHRIASGSDDKTVRIWDTDSGQAIGDPLQGHDDRVSCVAFLPNGVGVVSGSGDCTVRIWDVESGEAVREPPWRHSESVTCIAISPDGFRIASGSTDTLVWIWDVLSEDKSTISDLPPGHEKAVTCITISRDGRRIFSGSEDCTLRIWDAETGQAVGNPLLGHTRSVSCIAISPDGSRIISGSEDNTVRIWDADSGLAVGEPFGGDPLEGSPPDGPFGGDPFGCIVNFVVFSPDGHRVISAKYGMMQIWDPETCQAVGDEIKHNGESITFSPNGRLIVSYSHSWSQLGGSERAQIWDVESGCALGGPLDEYNASYVAFSPNGRLIVTGSVDSTVRIWDAESGQAVCDPLLGHGDAISVVVISPDGHRIVSGSDDTTLRVWDAESGRLCGEPLQGHESSVTCVDISPDGHRVVSGSGDGSIRIWDIDSSRAMDPPLEGHEDIVCSVAFSPDGRRIVSIANADTTALIWNAEPGQGGGVPMAGLNATMNSVAFSPDGRLIFTWVTSGLGGLVQISDVESGEISSLPLAEHNPRCFVLSPDGRRLVTGSEDMSVQLWDCHQLTEPPFPDVSSRFLADRLPESFCIRQDDGWVVNQNGDRLWFIPAHQQLWVKTLGLIYIYGEGQMVTFNFDNFRYGTGWADKLRQVASPK
ncbi:hypothetical protein DL96DRAFT_1757187 [Flagelloscypha sp. PMI_526]|nr:hypothetical protein DL96DRAFT_1757187 [Flagelloscypha sp. PMI_526]